MSGICYVHDRYISHKHIPCLQRDNHRLSKVLMVYVTCFCENPTISIYIFHIRQQPSFAGRIFIRETAYHYEQYGLSLPEKRRIAICDMTCTDFGWQFLLLNSVLVGNHFSLHSVYHVLRIPNSVDSIPELFDSSIQIRVCLHAFMILLKPSMNKGIDALACLHEAYIK